jgi:leucyl-tRNA synthetase
VKQITIPSKEEEIKAYIKLANSKTELQRKEETKDKTGVFTGTYAINPLNGKKIPIYVADYVLNNYATGIVMGVPAHDERD